MPEGHKLSIEIQAIKLGTFKTYIIFRAKSSNKSSFFDTGLVGTTGLNWMRPHTQVNKIIHELICSWLMIKLLFNLTETDVLTVSLLNVIDWLETKGKITLIKMSPLIFHSFLPGKSANVYI